MLPRKTVSVTAVPLKDQNNGKYEVTTPYRDCFKWYEFSVAQTVSVKIKSYKSLDDLKLYAREFAEFTEKKLGNCNIYILQVRRNKNQGDPIRYGLIGSKQELEFYSA